MDLNNTFHLPKKENPNFIQEAQNIYNLEASFKERISAPEVKEKWIYSLAISILRHRQCVIVNPPRQYALNADKLSLLHVAVIANNKTAVKELIDAKVDVNAKDAKGWTPLHHAALWDNPNILALLILSSTDLDAKNSAGGTFRDILNLTRKIKHLTDTINVFHDGQRMTEDEFSQLTGATYRTELLYSRIRMLQDWKSRDSITMGVYPFTEEMRKQYRQNPPLPHCLKATTHDAEGKMLGFSPGLGVFANRDIPKRTYAGEYLGHVKKIGSPASRYQVGDEGTDGSVIGNEISRINRSFPNVAMIQILNERGAPLRRIIITIEPVAKDKELFWNYGFNETALGPYVEMRPQAMREFLKKNDLKRLQTLLLNDLMDATKSFEDFVLVEQFRYILQTPSNIFTLILDGTLDSKVANRHLEFALQTRLIPNEGPSIIRETATIAEKTLEIARLMNKYHPETSKCYLEYCRQLTEKIGIANVLDLVKQANVFLSERINEKYLSLDPKPEGKVEVIWNDVRRKLEKEIARHQPKVQPKPAVPKNKAQKPRLKSLKGRFGKINLPDFLEEEHLFPEKINTGGVRYNIKIGKECRTYPGIGQKLTEEDYGKQFIRCDLYQDCDWSHMPSGPDANKWQEDIYILKKVSDKLVFTRLGKTKPRDFDIDWNDGKWVSPEKLKAHIETLKAKGDNFKAPPNDDFDTNEGFFTGFAPFGNPHQSHFEAEADKRKGPEDFAKAMNEILEQILPKHTDHTTWFDKLASNKQDCVKDYSFKIKEKPLAARIGEPNLLSGDPYEILGLSANQLDLPLLKKRYRELTLKHHPDKGGDIAKFRKIDTAFKALEKKVRDVHCTFEGFNFDEVILASNEMVKELRDREKSPEEKDFVSLHASWTNLLEQLEKVNTKDAESYYVDSVLDLRDLASSHVKHWEFRLKLRELNLTIKLGVSVEERIKAVQEILKSLNELDQKFDLENKEKKWTMNKAHLHANVIFLDKLAAFNRTLVELYILAGKKAEAVAIRQTVLKEIPIRLSKTILRVRKFETRAEKQPRAPKKDDFEFNFEPPKSNANGAESKKEQEIPSGSRDWMDYSETEKNEDKAEAEAVLDSLQRNVTFFEKGM